MSDFSTSTHRSKWILSRQELTEKRAIANDAAIKMLEQYGTTRVDVDIDGTISYPEPVFDLNSTAEINTSKKPLSFEEEQYLRVYYEHKIQEVCAAFYFPQKIQATALIYFKRFYLMWSVMQHHPKNIMLTCIYASCKVEENHVSAEELGKGISQDHLPILHNEMLVLQSLGFDLIVFAPYRSINGFVDDLEESGEVRHGDQEKLKETAFKEADKIMLTDAPLLFAPGQLALAALRRSNEINRIIDFERYLDSIISRQNSAYSVAELNELLSSIDYMVDQLEIPTNKDMTRSNKKLNICLAQDAGKKKERKSKRSKRTASEME